MKLIKFSTYLMLCILAFMVFNSIESQKNKRKIKSKGKKSRTHPTNLHKKLSDINSISEIDIQKTKEKIISEGAPLKANSNTFKCTANERCQNILKEIENCSGNDAISYNNFFIAFKEEFLNQKKNMDDYILRLYSTNYKAVNYYARTDINKLIPKYIEQFPDKAECAIATKRFYDYLMKILDEKINYDKPVYRGSQFEEKVPLVVNGQYEFKAFVSTSRIPEAALKFAGLNPREEKGSELRET